MTTRILVPVDFSTGADQALQLATSLARDHGGELVLLHIEEPPMVYGGGDMYYGLEEPNREELFKMLKEIVVDGGLTVQRHLTIGQPATAIVEFAVNNAVDYIVMPTHGRTGFRRLLMGSVAEEVVRKAPCPVMTVSPKASKSLEANKVQAPSYT